MTRENFYDIVVVGAGPAGLTFSQYIDTSQVSVLLLEKNKVTDEKPCGGALSLRTLNSFKIPKNNAERVIKGVRVLYKGLQQEISYNEPVMLNFNRAKLNEILLENVKRNGIDPIENIRIVNISRKNEYWELRIRKDNTIEEITARVLVGADGVNSLIAKVAGIRKNFSPDMVGFSVQYWISLDEKKINKNFGDYNEIYYGREVTPFGYAWVIPNKNKLRVGVGSLVSKIDRNLKYYLNAFLKNEKFLGSRIDDGKIINYQSGLTPLCGVVTPSYKNNVILIGDSAGHALPITGEGIAFAMKAGKIAAEVFNESIKKYNRITKSAFKQYEKLWIKDFGSDLKWGHWLMKFFMKKSTKDTKSKVLKNKKLAKAVADIFVGNGKIRNILIKASFKYLF